MPSPRDLSGGPVDKNGNPALFLYGPGDIIGFDTRHVTLTEPKDGTLNFEPNYFAGIEFDDPDLPWMFTPIDPSTVSHCANVAATDQQDAVAMATALWPATGDYYLRYMFGADLPASARESVRQYATQLVRARGAIPAIQIGKSPYGILPIGSFAELIRVTDRFPNNAVASLVQKAR
jgi:hypothetical protein